MLSLFDIDNYQFIIIRILSFWWGGGLTDLVGGLSPISPNGSYGPAQRTTHWTIASKLKLKRHPFIKGIL